MIKENKFGDLELHRPMAESSFTSTTLAMQSKPMYHVTNRGQKPIRELASEYNQRLKRLRYTKIDSNRCI